MMQSPQSDEAEAVGDWQQIGAVAQRMIMAWDEVEERQECTSLVTYTTERQRARIWQEMWHQASPRWRQWARDWLVEWHKRDGAK